MGDGGIYGARNLFRIIEEQDTLERNLSIIFCLLIQLLLVLMLCHLHPYHYHLMQRE